MGRTRGEGSDGGIRRKRARRIDVCRGERQAIRYGDEMGGGGSTATRVRGEGGQTHANQCRIQSGVRGLRPPLQRSGDSFGVQALAVATRIAIRMSSDEALALSTCTIQDWSTKTKTLYQYRKASSHARRVLLLVTTPLRLSVAAYRHDSCLRSTAVN
jgi:hypothetical protein